jgi:hypothetical protein
MAQARRTLLIEPIHMKRDTMPYSSGLQRALG